MTTSTPARSEREVRARRALRCLLIASRTAEGSVTEQLMLGGAVAILRRRL